jgi:hypothetical protein
MALSRERATAELPICHDQELQCNDDSAQHVEGTLFGIAAGVVLFAISTDISMRLVG